nr:hypothetical protein [Kibdelosporangium sp. MJ126-NF4]CEL17231.1 hypothetical protein [Kibdelosporangium sp. MJ126-NF4]CTQ91539.1 hypothetical protein [Kibdelosporangium sp. MJ126-NF4]
MFGKAVAATAALGITLTIAPSASAAQDEPLELWFEPVAAIVVEDDGLWRGSPFSGNSFEVHARDNTEYTEDGVHLFLSLPPQLHVSGYDGDRWNCWDVDGGIECTNPDTVVPEEEWPVLTVRFNGNDWITDSLDVYGHNDTLGDAHFGVPFVMSQSGT